MITLSAQVTTLSRQEAPARSQIGVLCALAALLVSCYLPMLLHTGRLLWSSDDMAHGFFAPIVAVLIVWDTRAELLQPRGEPSVWSLVLLGAGALLGTVAVLGNSSTFSRFAFLLSLAGCLLVLGGWQTLRRYLFPVLLLLFTFPVPNVFYGELTQPLQLVATRLSEVFLELLGFSVVREGNILQLPYMRLSVVEACSGLRSLITLIFFCVVYSYFFEARLWLRAVLVLFAIPCAIFVNALRITTTGLLGKYNLAWTEGTKHEIVGWSAFLLGFLLVLTSHGAYRHFARKGALAQ